MSEQTAEEGQSSISRVANHHQPSFTVCSSHWHDDTVTEPFQSRHVDLSQQENNRCMWLHPGIICSGSLQSSWYVSTGRHFNASQLCMSDYNRLHPPTTTSNTHWLHLSGRMPLLDRCSGISNQSNMAASWESLSYYQNSSMKCVSKENLGENKSCSCRICLHFNSTMFSFYSLSGVSRGGALSSQNLTECKWGASSSTVDTYHYWSTEPSLMLWCSPVLSDWTEMRVSFRLDTDFYAK